MIVTNEFGGIKFDGVVEGKFSGSTRGTSFNIESGAEITDHEIVEPVTVSVKGAVSNVVLGYSPVSLAGGLLSNFTNSGIVTTALTVASSSLNEKTRTSSTQWDIVRQLFSRKTFNVYVDGLTIENMILRSFERKFDVSNQGALIVDCDFVERRTIGVMGGEGSSIIRTVKPSDEDAPFLTSLVNRGYKTAIDATSSATSYIGGLF